MSKLKEKVIIITGGSGLIGQSIVATAKAEGARVINADIGAAKDLENGQYQCDITDENSIKEIIAEVVKKFGRLDGLVNNAYPRTKDWGVKFEDIPLESWRKNVDMQLNSYFNFCQQALKQMQEQQSGSIVNICSTYGVVSPDFTVYDGTNLTSPAAYAAIKGGLVNFTRYLAAYYGRHNIRVNAVSPGGIFDHQPDAFVKNYEHKVPMKRMGKPGDIGPPVAFLLSEEASYITGHNLMVDGGWTCI